MNFPLKNRLVIGVGGVSLLFRMLMTAYSTALRMPRRALSGDRASQLRLGNSAHSPTYSSSSSDQVIWMVRFDLRMQGWAPVACRLW